MIRKAFLLVLMMAPCFVAFSQGRAFGLRIGDPMGVTYKQYTRTHKAIEFILGTAARNWHRNYYENAFYDYSRYDGYTYRSHTVQNTIYLQGRYLLHYDIPVQGMDGKLEWYWGVGAMLKFGRIEYRYFEAAPENIPARDTRSNIDLGPDIIGGVEYDFEGLPLTVFGEASLMLELADRPLTPQLYGGVGLRFSF